MRSGCPLRSLMLQRARRRLARWRGCSLRRVLRSGCPLRSLALRRDPRRWGRTRCRCGARRWRRTCCRCRARCWSRTRGGRCFCWSLWLLFLRVRTQWHYRRCQNQNRRQSQEFCHDGNILNPVDQKNLFVQVQKYSHLLEARVDTDQQCLTPDIYFALMVK